MSELMIPFPEPFDHEAILTLRVIAIEGKDATTFLQGQLSQDVLLCQKNPQLAAALNPKGRVYALGWLVAQPNGFFWVLPQSIIASTLTTLKRYVLRSQVSLTDVSQDWSVALLPPGQIPTETSAINCLPKQLQDKTGWTGWLVSGKQTQHHLAVWHELCLSLLYPILTPATQGKFTAHELNIMAWEGVNFEKGCYTGQEIVARMYYRATPKTALSLVKIVITPEMDLYYGQTLALPELSQHMDLVDGQWQQENTMDNKGHGEKILLALAVINLNVRHTTSIEDGQGRLGRMFF